MALYFVRKCFVVSTFFLLVYNHTAYSLEKARFPINPNSDIISVSNKVPDWFIRARSLHNIAHASTADGLKQRLKQYSYETILVVAYNQIADGLRVLTRIQELDVIKFHHAGIVIIFRWPGELKDESEIVPLIENAAFRTAASNYTLNHKLFVGFNVVTNQNSTFILYHIYTLNNVHVYNKFKMERLAAILNCGICVTPLHEMNAHGQIVRVEVNKKSPGTNLPSNPHYSNTLDKFNRHMYSSFQKQWNFVFRVSQASVHDEQLPDGTWSGVVEDVVNKRADIGMSREVMLASRAVQISYLPPLVEDRLSAFFLQPNANAIRDIFLQPFETPLWIAATVTWFLLAVSIAGFTFILRKFGSAGHDAEPDQSGDSFIMILAAVAQQGWDEHPRAVSLRTVFILASFTCVITYAGYSAAIVSTLSTNVDLIQTTTALLKSHLRIGVRDDYPKSDFLVKRADGDILASFHYRMPRKDSDRLVNVSYAVHLIKSTPFAYLNSNVQMYETIRRYFNESDMCRISEVRVLQQRFQFGIFMSKGSPFREFFSRILILSRERGLLWRWKHQNLYVQRCLEASHNSVSPLGGKDVFSAFMVLVSGFILSIICLCIEKLVYRKTNWFIV